MGAQRSRQDDRPALRPGPYWRVSRDDDQCGNCGGVWFDKDEWEALKARDLHDDIYLIFTAPWQDQVRGQESRRSQEEIYRKKFGDEDFNEIQRMKAWIDGRPRKQEILAYLMSA